MGLFTKDIQTMDDLLLHGLKDIYYAENQIVKSLPKLIDKATNRDLAKGLKDHLPRPKIRSAPRPGVRQARREAARREMPRNRRADPEADEVPARSPTRKCWTPRSWAPRNRSKHYEIARYGTLIAWAESLGRDDVIRLLTTNLNEEKAADKKLSTVAVRKGVNRKAAS